jgi:hypothetical protein
LRRNGRAERWGKNKENPLSLVLFSDIFLYQSQPGGFIAAATASIAAGLLPLSCQRYTHEGSSTADPALHLDCPGRAVPCTGAAFHAPLRGEKDSLLLPFLEDPVRADFSTSPAVDAPFREEFERVFIV